MLTAQQLQNMQPDQVFRIVVSRMPSSEDQQQGTTFCFVAIRGTTFHDWAIYFLPMTTVNYSVMWWEQHVLDNGSKLTSPTAIKDIVPCDEEAFKLYRY